MTLHVALTHTGTVNPQAQHTVRRRSTRAALLRSRIVYIKVDTVEPQHQAHPLEQLTFLHLV